ncbi:DKNYY domain-containing protein, partial [bacterium]|nr:DKNYY domain-containing protein [bacterium]
NKKIEGADSDSFKLLRYIYAVDNKNVYRSGGKIEGADPKTFDAQKYNQERNKNIFKNYKINQTK